MFARTRALRQFTRNVSTNEFITKLGPGGNVCLGGFSLPNLNRAPFWSFIWQQHFINRQHGFNTHYSGMLVFLGFCWWYAIIINFFENYSFVWNFERRRRFAEHILLCLLVSHCLNFVLNDLKKTGLEHLIPPPSSAVINTTCSLPSTILLLDSENSKKLIVRTSSCILRSTFCFTFF